MTDNEKIAAWAGLECRCKIVEETYLSGNFDSDEIFLTRPKRIWVSCPRHSNNGLSPDYDRDEVAVSLLPIIVRKGYPINLYYDRFGVHYSIKISGNPGILRIEGLKPTIAAAIKVAIKILLEHKAS